MKTRKAVRVPVGIIGGDLPTKKFVKSTRRMNKEVIKLIKENEKKLACGMEYAQELRTC